MAWQGAEDCVMWGARCDSRVNQSSRMELNEAPMTEKPVITERSTAVAPRRIRKAVFPVAGLGTRFLPATKAMPKEML
ncbi:hypothetical protein C7450_1181, partial [Chelatococcus asaccharovorans]